MIDNKYTDLIHREIDGANSPQESAQLKAYLAANLEAQRFHDELASMSNLLREVHPVEPPAPLRDIVMYRLPNRYAKQPQTSLLATLREWLEAKANFKYAYVFAGGLTMGIVMYALLLQTTLQMPEDLNKISGTIGQREPAENPATTRSLDINREGVTGKIDLKYAAGAVVAEMALDAKQSISLTITFDEKLLTFKSLTVLDESASGEAVLIPGAAQLTHVGRKSYAVVFTKRSDAAGALNFEITRAGELLYEQTVQPE
jgi:hypothetical protein